MRRIFPPYKSLYTPPSPLRTSVAWLVLESWRKRVILRHCQDSCMGRQTTCFMMNKGFLKFLVIRWCMVKFFQWNALFFLFYQARLWSVNALSQYSKNTWFLRVENAFLPSSISHFRCTLWLHPQGLGVQPSTWKCGSVVLQVGLLPRAKLLSMLLSRLHSHPINCLYSLLLCQPGLPSPTEVARIHFTQLHDTSLLL